MNVNHVFQSYACLSIENDPLPIFLVLMPQLSTSKELIIVEIKQNLEEIFKTIFKNSTPQIFLKKILIISSQN